MIWNPGDDTDLNEGGGGTDTVAGQRRQRRRGSSPPRPTATRVRFDRIDPAPFAIDIGTSENLVLNANGGDDSFSATGNLAALIKITVDGGAGNDTILGSNGADVLLGGDGDDFVDGQQGNDVAFLGGRRRHASSGIPATAATSSRARTAPTRCVFNGSGGDEIFEASANGQRVRFTRNLGNIVMDLDDVEVIDLNALGGVRHDHRQRPVGHRCGRVRRRPRRRPRRQRRRRPARHRHRQRHQRRRRHRRRRRRDLGLGGRAGDRR